MVDGGVLEGLPDREVGLVELHVLADEGDRHRSVAGVDALDQRLPLRQVGLAALEVQHPHDEVVEPFAVHQQGDAVDVVGVARRHDRVGVDVAEQGDLLADALFDRLLGARDDDVGLDADLAQLGDRVLGRLGLRLADHPDDGHQRDVHVEHVLAADVLAELADGLEEGQRLDVADRAADLGDEHVDVEALRQPVDARLDLVRDVRDDLDRAPEVVAAALLGDDAVVDAAGRHVGVALDELVEEALVVAQVEVGLGAVLGDEDLAVLEGAHGAGVDVDVGVELLARDLEAARLEEEADGRGGDALAETRHHAARHEDVLGHAPRPLLVSAAARPGAPAGLRRAGAHQETPARHGDAATDSRGNLWGRCRARIWMTGRRTTTTGGPTDHGAEYSRRTALDDRRRGRPSAAPAAASAASRGHCARRRRRRSVVTTSRVRPVPA